MPTQTRWNPGADGESPDGRRRRGRGLSGFRGRPVATVVGRHTGRGHGASSTPADAVTMVQTAPWRPPDVIVTTQPATTPATTRGDARWMRRALAVAEDARGHTRPNPFVGAVVVADDHEVATGATGPAGTAHAEVRALQAAGPARGATLFVTLEPCAHVGRTPPCTDAIVAAGIARVVVGLADPNPLAAGGATRLREAGIAVTTGVLADEVAAQQEVFLATVTRGRPHVTLKIAQLPDGTTRPDRAGRRWITGPVARRRVHALRAGVDAVLVGSGTALADDPALTVRDAAPGPRPPRAVVLDRRGRLTRDLQVVRPDTIVVTAPSSDPAWRAALVAAGVDVVVADGLDEGLACLLDHDVTAVLAEPGTTLGEALVAADAVDSMLLHVADTTVDDDRAWTPAITPTDDLELAARRRLGDDVEWAWRRPPWRSEPHRHGTETPAAWHVAEPPGSPSARPGRTSTPGPGLPSAASSRTSADHAHVVEPRPEGTR